MTIQDHKMIADRFDEQGRQLTRIEEELTNARHDIQQSKTAQRAGKKRDWRIIKMLKGSR